MNMAAADPVDEVTEASAVGDRHDLLLAVILTLCTAFWGDLFGRGPHRPDYVASVITSIGMVLPLALRRRRPLLMVALMAIATAAQIWLVGVPTWALVALPVAAYSVARSVAGRSSRWVVVAGALASVVAPVRWVLGSPGLEADADVVGLVAPIAALCLAWVVIPYLLGRRDRETALARMERQRTAQERHEAELLQREQQTRMAEARVRNEIARELHDVVAHSLSVIIVQADGGKALARKEPAAASEVLGTISQTGREALGEMRRIVGVLRADPEVDEDDYRPAPGLGDIAEMVARAGHRVQLSVSGTAPAVPAALGVTAYRVVQEGLTNFLKHAPPDARATVALIHQPTAIQIEVANDGGSVGSGRRNSEPTERGYGLQGMHERVAGMGGTLFTQPTAEGGWIVRATLPLGHNGANSGQNGG